MLNFRLPHRLIIIGIDIENEIKFSIRSKGDDIREICNKFKEKIKDDSFYANGHKCAVGGIIKKERWDHFISFLQNILQK
jgi:single-stranded DNA-specific DHH superfamily exonuclease